MPIYFLIFVVILVVSSVCVFIHIPERLIFKLRFGLWLGGSADRKLDGAKMVESLYWWYRYWNCPRDLKVTADLAFRLFKAIYGEAPTTTLGTSFQQFIS